MATILERLPTTADLDVSVNVVLGGFGNVTVKVQGFAPGDLAGLVSSVRSLPVPNNAALVEATRGNLGRLTQIIPADPGELTRGVAEGLTLLGTDAQTLDSLLRRLAALTNAVAPFLAQTELLTQAQARIQTVTAGLTTSVGSVDLSNLAGQLEAISRAFDLFPEAVAVSPFKELRDQINSLRAWLTLDAAALSELFRGRIQSLADALPIPLEGVVQARLTLLAPIEARLVNLDRATWCIPYTAALTAVADLDLSRFDQLDAYLATVNDQIVQVTGLANTLGQEAQAIADGLARVDMGRAGQSLFNALLDILTVVGSDHPGPLAAAFSQIEQMLLGMNLHQAREGIVAAGQRVDAALDGLDFGALTTTLTETSQRVTQTVDRVDQALVGVATTLSNLVNQLRDALNNLDLAGLVGGVQTALTALRDKVVQDVLPTVTSVRQQVESFVNEVGQDISGLDMTALANAIKGLLDQIGETLNAADIKQVLDTVQAGVQDMVKQLDQVSLAPIFDEVIKQIEAAKEQVAQIDLSKLNDILKAALAVALAVIREVDFASDIASTLSNEFKGILDAGGNLTQPLQAKFGEIGVHIDQFAPGAVVADRLAPPYHTLVDALDQIKPATILAPLRDVYTDLLAKLDPLEPNALLAPLTTVHHQAVAALEQLSPTTLLQPLNASLASVTAVLNSLGLEALIGQVTEVVTRLNSLLDALQARASLSGSEVWTTLNGLQFTGETVLQNAETELDHLLDNIVARIGGLDMGVIAPALAGLRGAVTAVETHVNNPALVTHMDGLVATLDAQNFQGCVTSLTQSWLAQKQRFAAITPPPAQAATWATLKERLQHLSPLEVLAAPTVVVADVQVRARTAQADVRQARDGMVALLTESHDKLAALAPTETTIEAFRRLLRATLEEEIGQPAKSVLRVLRSRLQALGEIVRLAMDIFKKFQAPFQALAVIPDSLGSIGNALIEAKNRVLSLNLNFLTDELQGVIDAALAQLRNADPATVLADLQTIYTQTRQALQDLYPQAAIEAIDTLYRTGVVEKFKALDPAEVIGKPLDAQFKALLQLKLTLSLDQLFAALTAKLKQLGAELEAGLQRTAQSFNSLLAALPSEASLTVSVSL